MGKKPQNLYYVSGWDKRIGRIQGDTQAPSPQKAAANLAIRSGVPTTERWRLREFIDRAEVVLISEGAETVSRKTKTEPKLF